MLFYMDFLYTFCLSFRVFSTA